MGNDHIRGLLIEDDPADARLIREMVSQVGEETLRLAWCDRLSTGLKRLADGDVDLVLLDLLLPDGQGLDTLHRVRGQAPLAAVVVLTGLDDEALAVQSLRQGAQDYLLKGHIESASLMRSIRYAVERKHAEQAIRRSQRDWENIFQSMVTPAMILGPDHAILTINRAALNLVGKVKDKVLGKRCYEVMHGREKPLDGCPVEEIIKSHRTETREKTLDILGRTYLLSCTPVLDDAGRLEKVIHIATDVTMLQRAQDGLQTSLQKVQKAMQEIVHAMAMTVEMRDPYTAGHEHRVAKLASALATELGLSQEQIDGLEMAAVIHDLGKIAVPAEILSKPGRLTEMEFGMIKSHSKAGYDVLKSVPLPCPVAQIALQHHERMDGSGYPAGLSGEDIILEARILAVADVVEAMSSHRPYRASLGVDKALEEISQKKGILCDPAAVDACLRLFREKGFKLDEPKPRG